MKKFVAFMDSAIAPIKYITVFATAVTAALAAFHTELDKGLGKTKEGETNE